MVNERLDRAGGIDVPNALDRYRNSLARGVAGSRRFLVDVGSASGRFLHQNRREFSRLLGVEVSPECVDFSRRLGLTIETDLPALEEPPSVVTFWHSLEHIPGPAIRETLRKIAERAAEDTVVVVSVPNAESLQYRLLGERFAYYDAPNHLHQFTPRSLDRLFDGIGFERFRATGSPPYAAFGWLQGLLNLFNARHDYLYYRWKRGWDFGLSSPARTARDAWNLALAAWILIPCLFLTLHDMVFPNRGGVLTACYRKRIRSR